MTAVTTILLIMLLSAFIGAEQRDLQRQSVFNGEEIVDHALVARCESAYLVEMMKELGTTLQNDKLAEYPAINTEGIDCEFIIEQPFRVGNDFGLEGPPNEPQPTP
jgi:hypothetical protein